MMAMAYCGAEKVLLEKSEENILAADVLKKADVLKEAHYNAAANCLYHAVYLKVYRRLIRLGKDTFQNAVKKHAIALDYLYKESQKGNPDANHAHILLTKLKSVRVKANYSSVHVEKEEYDRAYEAYVKNKAPLERFLTDPQEPTEEKDNECEV